MNTSAEGKHHDHLICLGCGKIQEFENDRLEALQDQIARREGFLVRDHKLELYGYCRNCAGENKTPLLRSGSGRRSFMNRRKKSPAPAGEKIEKIALVGNPNVGKSVIFGWLTGKYVTVSNYPGTTVEVSQGNIKLEGRVALLVDTPGTNSLIPMSEDERVTRDILLEEGDLKVIQVGDAKNLRRALGITLQLAEMEKPVILVLNMADEAQDRGIAIDRERLSATLGIPVLFTIATRRKGLDGLTKSLNEDRIPRLFFPYSPEVEESIRTVAALLPRNKPGAGRSR